MAEARLRLFIEYAPASLAMFDREMRYVSVSQRWLSAFNLTGRDLAGLSHYDVFPEMPEYWKEVHRRGLSGEVVTNESDRFERADGSVQWLRWEVRPWYGSKGDVAGILVFTEDISGRKQIEEELRLTQASVDVAPEMIAWFAPDGRVCYANDATCRTLGYSHDEILRMTALDFSPGFTWEQYRQHWQEVRERQSFILETKHRRKDGSEYPAEILVNHVKYGGQEYIFAYGRDITERKAAEEALQASEEMFRRFFDNAPLGKTLTTPDGALERANPVLCQMLGYNQDELAGLSFIDITHPDDVAISKECVRALLAGDSDTWDMEKRYLAKDGHVVWVQVVTTLLRDLHGQPLRFLTHIVDISGRKATQAELLNSSRRSALLATVAQRLLGTENPQSIVEELCRMVMEHIDCQFFFNYLVDTPGQRMALNAFAGIPAATAETIRQLDFGVAVCGCAARDKQRIIAEHVDKSDDLRTQLVKSFGVRAYCCHPLMIEGELLGTLSFGTRTRPVFTSDEIALMKVVADHVALAMHRMLSTRALHQSEERMRASLSEKEVLLKEIHHRVKNNMQVISSLLDLQADEVQDEAMRGVFQDVIHRVRSMAMVHEKLYQSADLAQVDFADYGQSLLRYLWQAQGARTSGIELELDLQPVLLSINAAIPCGLILNELFTNALKHAFPSRDRGRIFVSLGQEAGGGVRLEVCDDGVGLPPELDWQKSRSLGLRIVNNLARQLHAVMEVTSARGARITLRFDNRERN